MSNFQSLNPDSATNQMDDLEPVVAKFSFFINCCFYCSVAKSCLTLCNPVDCSMSGFSVLHYLLEFAQIHIYWVGDALEPSHPLRPFFLLPSIFPSIRVFSNESALCIRCPKYWSFGFSTSTFNESSGFISFRIDWFDLLAVQRTLKSLLQHNNLKALVFWHSEIIVMSTSEYGREPNGTKHIRQSGQCLEQKS